MLGRGGTGNQGALLGGRVRAGRSGTLPHLLRVSTMAAAAAAGKAKRRGASLRRVSTAACAPNLGLQRGSQ